MKCPPSPALPFLLLLEAGSAFWIAFSGLIVLLLIIAVSFSLVSFTNRRVDTISVNLIHPVLGAIYRLIIPTYSTVHLRQPFAQLRFSQFALHNRLADLRPIFPNPLSHLDCFVLVSLGGVERIHHSMHYTFSTLDVCRFIVG